MEASHNIEYLRVIGEESFCFLKLEGQSGVRTRDFRLSKQAALTTAPEPPPILSESCADLTTRDFRRKYLASFNPD